MPNHTPGPWTIGNEQSVWMASQSDVKHVRVDSARGAAAVVPMWPSTVEGEANARLIRAAPEMLDLLTMAVLLVPQRRDSAQSHDWRTQARALISKVTY